MKNFINFFVGLSLLLFLISCDDNSQNPDTSSFKKLKMTIYEADNYDSTIFIKLSEYYFDGDTAGYARRTFRQNYGSENYKSILRQYRANVPLPHYKYGCLIKNIEFSSKNPYDTSYYKITSYEYDAEGYMIKYIFDSYSNSNPSYYSIYNRKGNQLITSDLFKNNILFRVRKYYYNNKGLCILDVDSSVNSVNATKRYNYYNEKNQFIKSVNFYNDTTNKSIIEYFYDDYGNKIKTVEHSIIGNDTIYTNIYNSILYKGYIMGSDDIENFEFDSDNNIIGYTNRSIGNTKYKIKYEFYK